MIKNPLHIRIPGIFFLVVLVVVPLASQQEQYFFYKPGQPRGSDATFNPSTLLLNGSFDALRTGVHEHHDLTSFDWKNDFQNVWNNITHPIESIRAYGWENFRRQEIINLSLSIDDLQFLPNVLDHTIGYGMLYAKITEWYDYHGYPLPIVWGVGTSLVYQYVNEMLQNGGGIYTNVDCVADYDIFNILGFTLFSFDGVKRFFSKTVELNDWPLQPLYIPRNHHLENVGQEFLIRYWLPVDVRFAPFLCWGVNSVAGLSYRYDNENSVSFGIGQAVDGIVMKQRGEVASATPNLVGAAGLFLDNKGSLLGGLIVRGNTMLNAQLNVFPGLVNFYGIRPGCYVGVGEREGLVVGLTFMNVPVSLGIER